MVNVYDAIVNYSKADFKEHLGKLQVFYIFKGLTKEFKDINTFKGVVKFIVLSYSLESDILHTKGLSWTNQWKQIYAAAGLPEDDKVEEKISTIKSDCLREAIELWLNFQSNEQFTQYCHYRDLRKHFLTISQTGEKAKERMDAMLYTKELFKLMEEAKAQFVENNPVLKTSMDALPKAPVAKVKKTLGPQDYAG